MCVFKPSDDLNTSHKKRLSSCLGSYTTAAKQTLLPLVMTKQIADPPSVFFFFSELVTLESGKHGKKTRFLPACAFTGRTFLLKVKTQALWEDLIFFCFPLECVCWGGCETGGCRRRRSSTGWAGSTGTCCRVEIGVRQVEGTDHVALYAPAVSSMERANHQQRPLASQRPHPTTTFLT